VTEEIAMNVHNVHNLDRATFHATLWLIHDSWIIPTIDSHSDWIDRVVTLAEKSKTNADKKDILLHWGQPHPTDKWDVR
jgi:hypothetical protein